MPEGLMRFPGVWYQVHSETARRFAVLRPSQQKGLALWVYGAILAGSATQTAVVASLLVWWKLDAIRQYLREWLYDGKDKAAACMTEVDVQLCFAPNEAPGLKIFWMPALRRPGMSASGMTPPPNTTISPTPRSRSISTIRGKSALCAPERIESPMASTSSCTAAVTIISGVW